MAWLRTKEAMEALGYLSDSTIRKQAREGKITRVKGMYWVAMPGDEDAPDAPDASDAPDAQAALGYSDAQMEAAGPDAGHDAQDIIADNVRIGQRIQDDGRPEAHLDSTLDQYMVFPKGRGRKYRQIDGWIARAILACHDRITGQLEDISVEPPPRQPRIHLKDPQDRVCSVVCEPTDLHVFKHAWDKETNSTWGREIVREHLMTATERLIEMTLRQCTPQEWITGIGSDWFHFDTDMSTTTKGTPQDTSGTYAEMLDFGVQLACDFIETLRRFAPVRIVNMAGNHDRTTSQALFACLARMYEDAEDVTIERNYHPRQYIEVGNTTVQMTHGDDVKLNQLPALLKTEAREMYGRTKYAICFHGHHHQERVREINSTLLINMPSLAGSDRWHVRKGYVGNRKSMAAYVIDHERGLVAQFNAEGK